MKQNLLVLCSGLLFLLFLGWFASIFPREGPSPKVVALVEALKKYEVPSDLMAGVETASGGVPESLKAWHDVHDPRSVVRDAWARRKEGSLPLLLKVAQDGGAPVRQRCGAALALGFCGDVHGETEAIKAALDALSESEAADLSRCALFARRVIAR